jgi:hypothetical protein
MSDDDKIYVDASQPATLVDGELNTDYPTLQGAAIAWHRMPPERQKTATIRDSTGREYTSQEIYRLNYAPKPDLAQSGRPTPASQPPFSFSYDSSDAASAVHAAARRNMALNMSGSVEPIGEKPLSVGK